VIRGVIKSKEWVGWANNSIVNPTSLEKAVLDCQKDDSSQYFFIDFTINRGILKAIQIYKIKMDKEIIELAKQLGSALKDKSLKIATAESCTGGGIAQAITEVPGSSAWFDRGFVTYSNQAKIQMLQVKQESLDDFGAVSKQVAIEMVEGAIIYSAADIAVSVTGIAGPTGGTEQKPVGTVYIAKKEKGMPASCKKHIFLGDRRQIRLQTVSMALKYCLITAHIVD